MTKWQLVRRIAICVGASFTGKLFCDALDAADKANDKLDTVYTVPLCPEIKKAVEEGDNMFIAYNEESNTWKSWTDAE